MMDADREDLRQRIELEIARNTYSKAAAAILDEIATTHVLTKRGSLTPNDQSLDSAIAHCTCLGWQWRIQAYQGDGPAHGLPDAKVWGPGGVGASCLGAATPGEGLWQAIEMGLELAEPENERTP